MKTIVILSLTTSTESRARITEVGHPSTGLQVSTEGPRSPTTAHLEHTRTYGQHTSSLARCRFVTRNQRAKTVVGSPYYLSVTLWWPRSTGFEVVTDEGVGRGVKAAVVQNQKDFC